MYEKKTKRPKALWTRIWPEQHRALYPERQAAGGMRWRSKDREVVDAVYNAIAALWRAKHPHCQCHDVVMKERNLPPTAYAMPMDDIHHKRGHDGLLYLDPRHWISVCRPCHDWIGNNVKRARELGLIEAWGKEEK